MAIENMYLSNDFIKELLKVSRGEKTSEELRQEVIKQYARWQILLSKFRCFKEQTKHSMSAETIFNISSKDYRTGEMIRWRLSNYVLKQGCLRQNLVWNIIFVKIESKNGNAMNINLSIEIDIYMWLNNCNVW